MNRILFLTSICLLVFITVEAQQDYERAIGGRLGYPFSFSYKHFINESHALEAYAGFRGRSTYSWVNVSAAYLVHKPIEDVDGLQWYFGAGASAYFWNFKSSFLNGNNYSNTTFGINGYLGLDYKFEDLPLNLSLDWIPTIFLSGFDSGFGSGLGSLGVRYTFG